MSSIDGKHVDCRALRLGWMCLLLVSSAACIPIQQPVNNPPVASAGADQSVEAGAGVTLDGSASSDPEGDALTFSWRQVSGAPVSLSSTTGSVITFTAPTIGSALVFELTVSDTVNSSTDQVTVSVQPVDQSARVIQLRQPSIQDDGAITGAFPAGWAFPTTPYEPADDEGEGAPDWITGVVGAPAEEVELAPGQTHQVTLNYSGPAILIGSAKWSGTTQALSVALSLDGSVLTSGRSYSTGNDRGGVNVAFVTANGGQGVLSLANTSNVTVKVRMVLALIPL